MFPDRSRTFGPCRVSVGHISPARPLPSEHDGNADLPRNRSRGPAYGPRLPPTREAVENVHQMRRRDRLRDPQRVTPFVERLGPKRLGPRKENNGQIPPAKLPRNRQARPVFQAGVDDGRDGPAACQHGNHLAIARERARNPQTSRPERRREVRRDQGFGADHENVTAPVVVGLGHDSLPPSCVIAGRRSRRQDA